MKLEYQHKYNYKVGGSLAFKHPTYVERTADRDLLLALKEGKFCYVFNCRQMGKSSLRVRMMHQLQSEGMSCASIDITSLGSDLSLQQWYGGIITQLFLGFNLAGKVNLKVWLREREELPPVQKLGHFLDEVILIHCPGEKIFIFIDEIDKVLSLNFSLDDFFSLIRFCYNQRAENFHYERLTFALFGVATPSDLIREKTQTPFNIGQPIELTGFTETEVQPLEIGLKAIAENPQAVLKAILDWTGGQPFLTQKLCQSLLASEVLIPWGKEGESVKKLVESQIIEHWESQDEPVHLKTIRDRLLSNQQRAGRLLGLYQQILQQGAIAADNSPEQGELRLSGLVVKRDSQLTVYNAIYQAVFNLAWVNQELGKFRPYSEAIAAWTASQYADTSRLLRGQALKDALVWANEKSLSSIDYQFLTESQKLDQREAELDLETARKANEILSQANQKAQRMMRLGFAVLVCSVLGAAIALRQAYYASQKQQEAQLGTQLQRTGDSAWRQFQFEQIGSLLSAMQAAEELAPLVRDRRFLQNYPATSPLLTLQQILDRIQEKNLLEGHKDEVMSVSFSPDGQWIASASRDRTVKLWSRQGKENLTLRGHQGDIYSVSFSPDGQRLATASQDGTIKLWDLQGKVLATFKGHQGSVYSVSFSPDGEQLASTSRDGTARLWDLAAKELAIFRGHEKSVDDVSFSPDGKRLVTASRDGTVRVWDLQGRQLQILKTGTVSFYSVSFSPDGKRIACAAKDGTTRIWDLQGHLLTTLKGHQDLVNSVSFSPDGQRLATASSDGTAKVWDLQGHLLNTLKGQQEPVYDLAWSPDGQEIATTSSDGTVKLWDLSEKQTTGFTTPDNRVTVATVAPNGERIAIASELGKIYLYNLQGKLERQFEAGKGWIYSLSFSPDGQKLATASGSGTVQLWDLQGKALGELLSDAGRVYSLSFSPDGRVIAIATKEGKVALWNLSGSQPQRRATWQAHPESIYSLSFSADGQRLATASRDKTVKLWDLEGHLEGELRGHEDLVSGVSFSPDGQSLVTASRDGTAKLWNLQGQLLKTLQGDSFAVTSASFSPNGQWIAIASDDGTTRLWDLQGNLRAEFKGHSEAIYGMGFLPNSQQVVTVARDGSVRIWQVEEEFARLERLLQQGCQWLDDYLLTRPHERETLPICITQKPRL